MPTRPRLAPASGLLRLPWPSLGPALACLLATLAVTGLFWRSVQIRDHARFQNVVESVRDRIGDRLETYEAVLLATRGLFRVQDAVTAEDFRRFLAPMNLQRRYPGIQGVGFSLRLDPAERAGVERALRAQGQAGFRVWPDDEREEWHTIAFLEPLDPRNRAALGFDMYSEPVRREAMARARDTGLPAATGRVTLVQEIDPTDRQAGFLIYVPVYRGPTPETVEERRRRLYGFVYAPFRMEDLLAGVFSEQELPLVAFEVFDHEAAPDRLLYRAGDFAESSGGFLDDALLVVDGRTWYLRFHTLPAFDEAAGVRFVPYVFASGALLSLLVFFVSRSRVRAREALQLQARLEQAARADAEAASRAKDEFLAMLGHELRNPLAPIATALELLRLRGDGKLGPELAMIDRQLQHVRRLVDDLLDVSRITRGKIELARRPVALARVVSDAIEIASPLLERHGHRLVVEVPESLVVDGDPTRLAQVVANLLTNAAKFTPEGGRIAVAGAREGDTIVLHVRDSGAGIAADLLPHVFELFTQGQRHFGRSQGGLGIGLTLVRNLVEAHGGTVEARSGGVGKGSEFVIRLPAAGERAGGGEARPASPRRRARCPRRVLVVDDNHDAAEALSYLLSAVGHEVALAHDGPEALRVAAAFAPDVAVLDVGLPVMDGYELAERLRESGTAHLIAVTGYGQERDRARARAAGFAVHLVKPVDAATLCAAIDDAAA